MLYFLSYKYYFFIFIISLFCLIYHKQKVAENEIFKHKILNIDRYFRSTYKECIKCIKNKCIYNLTKSVSEDNKFAGYKTSDIPGPYPYDYPYLENIKNICKNNTIIFVSVISLCNELEERIAIRKVYDNIDSSIRIHFFVGYTSNECQKQYSIEKRVFKDISQIPIQESYVNQSLFTLYLHKILPTICPYAKYYGKMDADQYIDYLKLMHLLKKHDKKENVIYSCNTWKFKYVPTNQNYKYSSPKIVEKYYRNAFPKNGIKGFTGSFALYPSSLSSAIYRESLNETNIIRMEDQHIAWLIYKLNMKNMNISYFNLKCQELNKKINFCSFQFKNKIGIHRIKGKDLYISYELHNTYAKGKYMER